MAFRARGFNFRINESHWEMYGKRNMKIPIEQNNTYNFCESSNIYKKEDSAWSYQNFQILTMKDSIEISEFEIGWTNKKTSWRLIGIKNLYLSSVDMSTNNLYPLFDEWDRVIGTQLLPNEASEPDETS